MKYYVVADVHGYYTYLMKALENAGYFTDTEPRRLIVCGDLLDRGEEAREVVDFMMKELEEGRLIYVLGNHEELLVSCLNSVARGGVHEIASGLTCHTTNGTWDTLLQIAEMEEMDAYHRPLELVTRVRQSDLYKKLLSVCVDYYETPNYVFVHGWIPCHIAGVKPYLRYSYDENWRGADSEAWYRARWVNGMELACKQHILEPDKTVVCGHWRASYGHAVIERKGTERGADADYTPFYGKGVIGLDAHAAVSGFLNCIVIED